MQEQQQRTLALLRRALRPAREPQSIPATSVTTERILLEAAARVEETFELAAPHLDPSLVDVLRILGFDRNYVTARGSYLYDAAGQGYLDFHTGEGFASLGHNNPDLAEVLHAVLRAELVDGVQIHYSPLARMLAEELTQRLPACLEAVLFANSGAAAVDCAMKLARAATGP